MRRSLTVARDVTVRVISWNAKQKRAFTVTRSRGGARGASGRFYGSAVHIFRMPGLTEEQGIREAERRLADITRHQRTVEAVGIPGDPSIDVRTILRLIGTGTSFDQDYSLDETQRRISFEAGFTMNLRARNVSPESSAAL